jgi:hypothetical protein
MSEDKYPAIKVYSQLPDDEENTSMIKYSMGVIESINSYINILFNFVLKMNPPSENNMIGFSRTIVLVIIVAILGFIIILPTFIIYNMKYMSPHDDEKSDYVKISNFQNKYIMVTSSIWIIMFCIIILFSPIKST